MFVVNGQLTVRSDFKDVAKRLEAGLGPIVKRQHGFCGYYVVQTGERTGQGVLVFDTAQDWEAAQGETLAWYEKNITPLCEGEALATSGEVLVSVEPDAMPDKGAAASAAAEARPH